MRSGPFQRQPGSDVSLVVHVGYDNLVPVIERLSDRQTHQTNKGSGVHAKRDFARIGRVYEISDAVACTQNHLVHFTAFRVASAPLHIALEEMMIHRVQHGLWNLRARRIIKKDEGRRPGQGRKSSTNGFNGKGRTRGGGDFGVENTLGFGLQISLLVTSENQLWQPCKMTSAKPILRCNNSST